MATLTRTIGSTTTANYIEKINQNNSQHFSQSVVFGKQQAYNELIELWDECQTTDWDGYNALPIQEKTFKKTWAVIEALPLTYPLPTFGAEPDGHITLEWYRHPRWILSISISPEGYLYYAALFGEDSTNGSEFFLGEISTRILNLIEQVNIQKI
ncbi:hypothetical protein [Spirulina sp. 06S082]|uniref:hypothetical protein n=1 Tax=Spirulina sp. 06S082 TaxID=3110248 RepID=UPI002B1FC61D|nr:hypothetical protein [Spirulina sp. 06S082]MEA5468588.1 hypothetical protein [Spirulina sp. 06S082]